MSAHIESQRTPEGLSIVHKECCYHFRRAGVNDVRLSVVDELDSGESLPGELVPRVPGAVKDELRAKGLSLHE